MRSAAVPPPQRHEAVAGARFLHLLPLAPVAPWGRRGWLRAQGLYYTAAMIFPVLAPLLLAATASAAAPPATRTFEGLTPGTRGVCRTVFAGTQVEDVAFEVRGVMKNYLGPRRDLLVIRLLGDKPEFTGVVAGMSGSPCAVDGVLVGALGYSFAAFAKEPIAGVTPIDDMLAVLRLPKTPLPWRRPEVPADAAAPAKGTGTATTLWPDAAHRMHYGVGFYAEDVQFGAGGWARATATTSDVAVDSEGDTLRPLRTPLRVAGVSAAALAPYADLLAGSGLALQRSGGAGSDGAAPAEPLVPGGPVAAVLVRGDVDVAGTGTVTWVHDGQVLAFGHPFFGAGPTSMPLANARIVNTMASAQRSFKMAVTGATVGELTQDRLPAIGGVLGQAARTVPVRGSVTHNGEAVPFRFDVVRDPRWTGPMLAMALSGALEGRATAQDRGTARLTVAMQFEGAPPVTLHQVASGPHDAGVLGRLGQATAAAFDALWNAPDGATPGEAALQVTLTLEDEVCHEEVTGLRLDRARAEAGDEVTAAVALSRQDAPPATARFRFRVPAGWAGEEITLFAAGAADAHRLERAETGEPRPKNRVQVAEVLGQLRRPDAVHLLALRRRSSLQYHGAAYPALPPSTAVRWAHGNDHALAPYSLALESAQGRRGSVTGQAGARLQVAPPR